jgi:hypothetical protein
VDVAEIVKFLRKMVENREELPERVPELQDMVWKEQLAGSSAIQEILRDLAYDLDFYEPDPHARAEDESYFGDERALAEIQEALEKVERVQQ